MSIGPTWRTLLRAFLPSAELRSYATQNAAIEASGGAFNLIGVDYQTRALSVRRTSVVTQYLEGVDGLHASRHRQHSAQSQPQHL